MAKCIATESFGGNLVAVFLKDITNFSVANSHFPLKKRGQIGG